MDQEYERKVKYIETTDACGRPVTHMIFDDNGRYSKKKKLKNPNMTFSTKNVNGKVITEIIYEQD